MTAITVVVEADWGRTGLYDHAESDITGDVLAWSTQRGRDYASQIRGVSVAGRATIDVLNTTGKYSRTNTAGALTGLLKPGVPVRIRATSPSAAIIWTGTLTSIDAAGAIQAGTVKRARLRCDGPLARLRALGKVTVTAQASILTGAAIELILDEAGVTERRIENGQTTLDRWWVEDKSALEGIRDLEETERGFLLEAADGAVVFEDRHHRLKGAHLTSQATFSDAAAAARPYHRLEPRDGDQEIFNDITIPVRHFTTQSLAVLWTYQGDAPVVAAGETLTLWAAYPPSATPAGRYVEAWTTPVVGTDVTQTGVSNSDLAVVVDKFSRSMKVEVTNSHATAAATLTLVQARGTGVTEDDPTLVTAEDAASQADGFGKRSIPRPGVWHQSLVLGQGIADFLVSRYAEPLDPQPVGVGILATYSAALMGEALARDISDRITVVAENSPGADQGLSGAYFIESVRHDYTVRGGLDTFFDLSPASGDSGYWAIGEVGFSELGETTRLAPV